jgi:hypothetical protein
MISLEQAHGMLVAIVDLVERYVPPVRQKGRTRQFLRRRPGGRGAARAARRHPDDRRAADP